MIHAYDEMYLQQVQQMLGNMLDAAVNELTIELIVFYRKFLNAKESYRIASGDSLMLSGKSGTELLYDILGEDACEINFPMNKSPEYWTGWALAYYQWHEGISFQRLNNEVPIETIRNMYIPYHEMDIEQFVEKINELRQKTRLQSYLKLFRQKRGLTQKELSEMADIPIKTIQQYEQRQKNINKAQAEYIIKLSRVLCCKPEELLEPES